MLMAGVGLKVGGCGNQQQPRKGGKRPGPESPVPALFYFSARSILTQPRLVRINGPPSGRDLKRSLIRLSGFSGELSLAFCSRGSFITSSLSRVDRRKAPRD